MASRSAPPEEDLTCPFCRDIFKDPVFLLCSHSVCKVCLQEYWKERRSRDCPVCKKKCISKGIPRCNLVLKNLCESFLLERGRKVSEECEDLCREHKEKLQLFCLDDQKAICVVCQASREHKNHNCCPIDEASLYQRNQVEHTEMIIKKAFQKLHQFLQEEEEVRISVLRDEEQQKSQMMKNTIEGMNREISSLSDTIKDIEEKMRAEDLSFLQNYKATVERTQCTFRDPPLVSASLIEVAKHLANLQFKVWEKMQGIVKYSPVTLDPNSAHPSLILSEDLTSVHRSTEIQQLPNNTERFDYYVWVLGSEGFTSGMHSWDVEVGNNTFWSLGVIEECTQRKAAIKTGHWRFWYFKDRYGAFTPPDKTIVLQEAQKLQRIRVHLDWNKGKLSFF